MMFKRKKQLPNFEDVHNYTVDLQRVTLMRDKTMASGNIEEANQYNEIIRIMQIVMVRLNEVDENKK